jgi:hypothetical protein
MAEIPRRSSGPHSVRRCGADRCCAKVGNSRCIVGRAVLATLGEELAQVVVGFCGRTWGEVRVGFIRTAIRKRAGAERGPKAQARAAIMTATMPTPLALTDDQRSYALRSPFLPPTGLHSWKKSQPSSAAKSWATGSCSGRSAMARYLSPSERLAPGPRAEHANARRASVAPAVALTVIHLLATVQKPAPKRGFRDLAPVHE